MLRGTEIKSIRAHKVSLADAYARIDRDEAWIVGLHIAPWENADVRFNHEPKRSRKLLLHREEIDELLGKTKAKGLTLVPLRLYINDQGKAKVLLGLARGKQTWDRRREIAERDARARDASAPSPTPGDARPMRLARMIQAVDAHAAGEPGRVIVGGVLDVPGASMFEKMRHLAEHGDELRRLMLREPRGYPALCANVVLPPTHPEAPTPAT